MRSEHLYTPGTGYVQPVTLVLEPAPPRAERAHEQRRRDVGQYLTAGIAKATQCIRLALPRPLNVYGWHCQGHSVYTAGIAKATQCIRLALPRPLSVYGWHCQGHSVYTAGIAKATQCIRLALPRPLSVYGCRCQGHSVYTAGNATKWNHIFAQKIFLSPPAMCLPGSSLLGDTLTHCGEVLGVCHRRRPRCFLSFNGQSGFRLHANICSPLSILMTVNIIMRHCNVNSKQAFLMLNKIDTERSSELAKGIIAAQRWPRGSLPLRGGQGDHCRSEVAKETIAAQSWPRRPLPLRVGQGDHCHSGLAKETIAAQRWPRILLPLRIGQGDHCHSEVDKETIATQNWPRRLLPLRVGQGDHCHSEVAKETIATQGWPRRPFPLRVGQGDHCHSGLAKGTVTASFSKVEL